MSKKTILIAFLLLVFGVTTFYIRSVLLTKQEVLPEGGFSTAEDSSSLPNFCQTDKDCIWYEETQGDPAGRVHCSGINYSKTCKYCRRLPDNAVKNLPENFRCICDSKNRCQEDRLKCGPGEYLKQCKRGPCCCPSGTLCD